MVASGTASMIEDPACIHANLIGLPAYRLAQRMALMDVIRPWNSDEAAKSPVVARFTVAKQCLGRLLRL